MRNQRGQVVLILILVMTVALAIGISVIQRSLSDISTSSKVEQSSRAFSAAEAGIENKLSKGTDSVSFTENGSSATVSGGSLIPAVPAAGNRQDPLEYPPLAKEEVAHVWLINDINDTSNPPIDGYKQSTLDVYWGNSTTDFAALELTMVYYSSGQYQARKWYLDNSSAGRSANNFDQITCTGGYTLPGYQCKKTLGDNSGLNNGPLLTSGLKLIRARLLYNKTSQPFAVQAVNTCGPDCSITPQARILISTGTSGTTQRKVRLFQVLKVVPPYFDFAIFSAGTINK